MSHPHAFVIEDDQDIGEIYTAALRAAKFEPIYLSNGMEALERLRTVTPQLVVLDLHLPKLTGEMLLQAMRSDTRLKDAWIIVVTADSALGDKLRNSADFVLIKPVGFHQIRELALRRFQQ